MLAVRYAAPAINSLFARGRACVIDAGFTGRAHHQLLFASLVYDRVIAPRFRCVHRTRALLKRGGGGRKCGASIIARTGHHPRLP